MQVCQLCGCRNNTKEWFKAQFSKVLPLCALSEAYQHCCSSSFGDFRYSIFVSPVRVSGLSFHQVPCLVRTSLCLAPYGAHGPILCSGLLVMCSCHIEGCISCVEKNVFERRILPFSAVTEQIVCV